jgi:hypothetical protein
MQLRKLVFLSGLVLAVVAMSPAAAMGAAHGTNRPPTGTTTTTYVASLTTGVGTNVSSGHISHLGAITNSENLQFALVGPNGITWTGTGTIVAANGDKLFATISGTGAFGNPISTAVDTITGGTGRFAGASGMFTSTGLATSVSIVDSIETVTKTVTIKGTISY